MNSHAIKNELIIVNRNANTAKRYTILLFSNIMILT